MADIRAARAAGLEVNGQVGCRPIGMLMGLETSIHPFLGHPAWVALEALSPEARYRRLSEEPELRRRLVAERPTDPQTEWTAGILHRLYPLGSELDYNPPRKTAWPDERSARTGTPGNGPWTGCWLVAARES